MNASRRALAASEKWYGAQVEDWDADEVSKMLVSASEVERAFAVGAAALGARVDPRRIRIAAESPDPFVRPFAKEWVRSPLA